MKLELVVFDWDGTLLNSTATIVQSIQAACRDLDLPVPPDALASYVIGLGLAEALATAVPAMTEQMVPRMLERYRFHYLSADHELKLFDGVHGLLDDLLARGAYLAIATGKNRVGLDRALRNAGLEGVFHTTRCADESRSKPHPQMLLDVMRAVGADPGRTVMVGDTTHDLNMARNASTHAVAVNYGAHPDGELRALQPAAVVDSIGALQQWLGERV
jgi:phosphoglycolate phosphatase